MAGESDPKGPAAAKGPEAIGAALTPTPTAPVEPANLVPGDTERVDREVVAYIEQAPEPVRDVLLTRLVRSTTFVGPLPPPEMIAAYDSTIPGMGRELLDAFLEEGKHRRRMNEREFELVTEDNRDRRSLDRRGMHHAGLLAVLGILIAGAAILMGHDAAGTIFGGAELTALVTAFLVRRYREADEPAAGRERKPGPKKKDG